MLPRALGTINNHNSSSSSSSLPGSADGPPAEAASLVAVLLYVAPPRRAILEILGKALRAELETQAYREHGLEVQLLPSCPPVALATTRLPSLRQATSEYDVEPDIQRLRQMVQQEQVRVGEAHRAASRPRLSRRLTSPGIASPQMAVDERQLACWEALVHVLVKPHGREVGMGEGLKIPTLADIDGVEGARRHGQSSGARSRGRVLPLPTRGGCHAFAPQAQSCALAPKAHPTRHGGSRRPQVGGLPK